MAIDRYVVVEGNTVGNRVSFVGLGDDDWAAANPTAIQVSAGKDVAPGYTWNGAKNFSPPAPINATPTQLTRRQFRRVLSDNGNEFADIKALIHALPNPRRRTLMFYIEQTMIFERSDPELTDMLVNVLGFAEPQINLLFIAGNAP